MAEPRDKDPFTLLAIKGREGSRDVTLAIRVLAKMGFGPEVIREYEDLFPKERDPERYPIDEIAAPDHWMGKEHFLSYRDRYATQFTPVLASRVFFTVTTGEVKSKSIAPVRVQLREHTPLGREIPEPYRPAGKYTHFKNRAAIRADGLVEVKKTYIDYGHYLERPYGAGEAMMEFLKLIGELVEERITPPEQHARTSE